jgi:hypothetical protein
MRQDSPIVSDDFKTKRKYQNDILPMDVLHSTPSTKMHKASTSTISTQLTKPTAPADSMRHSAISKVVDLTNDRNVNDSIPEDDSDLVLAIRMSLESKSVSAGDSKLLNSSSIDTNTIINNIPEDDSDLVLAIRMSLESKSVPAGDSKLLNSSSINTNTIIKNTRIELSDKHLTSKELARNRFLKSFEQRNVSNSDIGDVKCLESSTTSNGKSYSDENVDVVIFDIT